MSHANCSHYPMKASMKAHLTKESRFLAIAGVDSARQRNHGPVCTLACFPARLTKMDSAADAGSLWRTR